jgi:hypothetical protein
VVVNATRRQLYPQGNNSSTYLRDGDYINKTYEQPAEYATHVVAHYLDVSNIL